MRKRYKLPVPTRPAPFTFRPNAEDARRLARIRRVIDARSDAEALRRAIAIAEAHLEKR